MAEGAGRKVSVADGVGEAVGEKEGVGETVVEKEGVAEGEKEGVKVGDCELVPPRDGDAEGDGVALAFASLYIVPPESTTTISLLFDSAGEPYTGFARGTAHIFPPELFRERRRPETLATFVPTTSSLKQLKWAGVEVVKVSLTALIL